MPSIVAQRAEQRRHQGRIYDTRRFYDTSRTRYAPRNLITVLVRSQYRPPPVSRGTSSTYDCRGVSFNESIGRGNPLFWRDAGCCYDPPFSRRCSVLQDRRCVRRAIAQATFSSHASDHPNSLAAPRCSRLRPALRGVEVYGCRAAFVNDSLNVEIERS